MKTHQKNSRLAALLAAGLLAAATAVQATNYAGNGDTSFGGDIGNGALTLTDNGTNISGTLVVGHGNNMYNTLVLFVDTGAGGGFADTSTFNDQNDSLRIGISGVSGSGRSLLSFTNGFRPQFAIALGPTTANFGGVWALASGNNNSLNYVTSANLSPVGTSTGPFTFSVPATALGLTNGVQKTIKILGTYISGDGYRAAEAIAGNVYSPFGAGRNAFTQTAFGTYTFAPATIPTYNVTFRVDLTEQIATGAFNPNNGDTVYAAGTFQTNAWTGNSFQLLPTSNTNIYSATYPDQDTVGTSEAFKYMIHSVSSGNTTWENDPNRTFTLQSGGQTLPLSYFNFVPASPSATTNALNFSINMEPQTYLGNFHPATDSIEVFGAFQNPAWSGGLILTNSPGNTNVYSGSFPDHNYPGAQYQYKYVIVNSSATNYESGANRTLTTTAGANNLPLAYFSGVSNIYSIPITFQVDMSLPLATGAFVPGNGDTISVSGTFQTNVWTPGIFTLAPSGSNANIYVGTYTDKNQPGAGEQFKFVITQNGTNFYETISDNRTFLLGSAAQTLPVVYYNNLDPNNALLADTTVTFTVDMNNAVDLFGNAFVPGNDLLFVDGNFTNPQWPVMSHATDETVDQDYSSHVMTNNPVGSTLYSAQFVVPAGNNLQMLYKYGIYHNTGVVNTNVDNEAGFGQNHTRFIRVTGSYNLPVDSFGQQRTNLAAATEATFGNLVMGQPSGTTAPVSWLGRPGVYLQTTTNLFSGAWSTIPYTNGVFTNNWHTSGAPVYFRLYNP